jgi:hypothetical protein
MNDRPIERLKDIDPARYMPATDSAMREATRQRVLATALEGRVAARGSGHESRMEYARTERDMAERSHNPRRVRRGVVLAVIAVLLLLVAPATGAWAYFTYFSGPETVMDEFRQAQKDMPLPDGVEWVEPDLPADALYGSKMGFIAAWSQAFDAWLGEWVAAHDAGDTAREQTAIAAAEHLIGLAPVHKEGDPEEAGGFVQQSIAWMQGMVDRGKQGDLSGIEEYLAAN